MTNIIAATMLAIYPFNAMESGKAERSTFMFNNMTFVSLKCPNNIIPKNKKKLSTGGGSKKQNELPGFFHELQDDVNNFDFDDEYHDEEEEHEPVYKPKSKANNKTKKNKFASSKKKYY
jgi:hypothetical protein